MLDSDSTHDKGNTIIYKYECLDCENYKRKVIETEQTISGRDVLIEMLQQEIKKMEEKYKTSIDDYEKLRFKYCTVVQDLGCLKEIHKKLEKSNSRLLKERDIARNHLEILQKEIGNCQRQCGVPMLKSIPSEGEGKIQKGMKGNDSLHQNILKEVMNMEVIMQNQNESVKEALLKVLNEVKGVKSSRQVVDVLENTTSFDKDINNESKENLLTIIHDLNKKIDELNTIVQSLRLKNENIVKELTDKKNNLAQCLDVLEDNHSNLNSLSGNIEMIINEKETYLHEKKQQKKILDEYEKKLQVKDKEISYLKSRVGTGDSLTNLEVESLKKRNQDLQKALTQCEADLEKLQEEYLEQEKECTRENCRELAKALATAQMNEHVSITETKSQSTSAANIKASTRNKGIDAVRSHITETKSQSTSAANIKASTRNKGTDAVQSHEHQIQINSLKERIKTLEYEIEQVKLENSEYEEENKSYAQKLETFTIQLHELEKEKVELENQRKKSVEVTELKGKYEIQIAKLQNEIASIQEKDEKLILMLQDKIYKLENSQNEKQIEIDQCCCVLQGIQATLADTTLANENTLCQTALLEDQKKALEKEKQEMQRKIAQMQNEIAEYEYKFKDCDCKFGLQEIQKNDLQSFNRKLQDNVKELEIELCRKECLNEKIQEDVKKMEMEICQKQCTVNHLEQCLDKSNKILAECEKEIREMHAENESLRKENVTLKKDLQIYAVNVERTSTEKQDLQEKVSRLRRQSQDLEMEKDILSMNLKKEKSTVEEELSQLKKMYNNLLKTLKDKDEEIKRLQNVLESTKKDYDEIFRAYKDVKHTLAEELRKYKDEVEKILKEKDSYHIDLDPNMTELKKLQSEILEKEQIIMNLEQKNRELSAEVAHLKSCVHKTLNDNKNLRVAIDNLLSTLVDKLRNFTDNEESISLKSNEVLVKQILSSLMDLEKNVKILKSSASSEKCNCMSVIMSTYKLDPNDVKTRNMPPCKQRCGKKVKDLAQYVDSKLSGVPAVMHTCQTCCKGKPQNDASESLPELAITRSVSQSYISEQRHSW